MLYVKQSRKPSIRCSTLKLISFARQPNIKDRSELSDGKPYFTRLGGYCRKDIEGPDDTGKTFANYGLAFCDSFVGYDPIESLMICKKYGIQPYFYLPDCPPYLDNYWGIRIPFAKCELVEYREKYKHEMNLYVDWIDRFTKMYDIDVLNNPEQIWILYNGIDMMPVNLFESGMEHLPDVIAKEFYEEFGFDIPLYSKVSTSQQRAEKTKFWRWIRKRFEELYRTRAEVFREFVPVGRLVSNFHWNTQLDMMLHSETFDIVGINTRPLMLDNEVGRRYETGYAHRLFADVCGQTPIMSAPRANLFASSPQNLIAGRKTIEYTYSQAIQNGVIGFYIFFQDFSAGREEYDGNFTKVRKSLLGLNKSAATQYCGSGNGNPDLSTLPLERWNTLLEITKKTASSKRFLPPKSETGILVSNYSCSFGAEDWKMVFSAYVELTKARVWANFAFTDLLLEGKADLSQFKTLYLPSMPFENKKIVEILIDFVKSGNVLIAANPQVLSYDEDGNDISSLKELLFGVKQFDSCNLKNKKVAFEEYDLNLESYSNSWKLFIDKKTNKLAQYSDGSIAISSKKQDNGEAIMLGLPVMDCYDYIRADGAKENVGRYNFYKRIEKKLNIMCIS